MGLGDLIFRLLLSYLHCLMPLEFNVKKKKLLYHFGKKCNKRYYSANRSMYRHMVCNVPVSCKASRTRNQLGAWLYSDRLVVVYSQNCKKKNRKEHAEQDFIYY